LGNGAGDAIEALASRREACLTLIDALGHEPGAGIKSRVHGDYHLGQVLIVQDDLMIVDFEGEPSRPAEARRGKSSPLRDVAGMIRSFEYAAAYGLRHGPRRAEDVPALQPWARLWVGWASAAFLGGYLQLAGDAEYLPRDAGELGMMLEFYLLDKTVYELRYELNNRPSWVSIPLEALLRRVEHEAGRVVAAK
jgi:maltose alpha-D-glucosyltransferase/alpha-amylase